MTKSKHTKRALLMSMMSMLLCVAMLVGATFAWFTDSSSTGVNKIQAGTLDIELQMKNAEGSWVSAEGQTLSFVKDVGAPAEEAILWEPGCTYNLQDLKLVNKSNLALKYKVLITGIKGDAALNNAIDWTIKLDGADLTIGSELHWLPTDAVEKEFTISGHMKEAAGNEYQGLSIDGIAITVIATQDTVEYDSNGNSYDQNAAFPYIPSIEILADTTLDGTNTTPLLSGNTVITAANNTLTLGNNTSIGLGTAVDMGGTTQKVANTIKADDGQSLTMINGELVKEDTFGKIRFDTKANEQEGFFEHIIFTDKKAPTHTGSASNDTDEMIQICPNGGGTGKYIFRDCTFNNANITVNGMNDGAPVEIIFENCTFNNTGNASAIDITSNYTSGKVTIKDCTFNLVTTSNISAVEVWGSKDFDVIFEGANTVNGSVADSRIYNLFAGGTSVKAYSVSGSGVHNVTGINTITVTGIATK